MTKVLVVEEEAALKKLIIQALEDVGLQVVSAFSLRGGFDALHSYKPGAISVAFIDWQFEDGTSQLLIADAVQCNVGQVVVMSGGQKPEVWPQARHAGADSFLSKPLDFKSAVFYKHLASSLVAAWSKESSR